MGAVEPVADAPPPQPEAPGTEAGAPVEPVVAPLTTAETDLTNQTQKPITEEKEATTNGKGGAKPDLPTRQYLDLSVVPILLQALTALSKERPPDAIDFLIAYLAKNKSSFQQQQQQQPNNNS